MAGERGHFVRLFAAGALAYAAGSFPTADIAARIAARRSRAARAVDLRAAGTMNPGALNASKLLGARWGLAVLAGDIAKGALAATAGRRLAGDRGAYLAGITSVAGHCFPAFSGFRGGKGVATSAGTSAVCFPAYVPFDVALAASVAWLTKGQAGAATYLASSAFVLAAWQWHRRGLPNLWGPAPTAWLPAYAAVTSTIIAYKFLTAPPARDGAYGTAATDGGIVLVVDDRAESDAAETSPSHTEPVR